MNQVKMQKTPRVWDPASWREYPILQQPEYEDKGAVEEILSVLKTYPPLIYAGEVDRLKQEIAEAAEGKRFILQGGDCAERFQDCTRDAITTKLKILMQMSAILCYASGKPVVRIGRIAGQYAKPRSAVYDLIEGEEILSYRGDLINSFEPKKSARIPDPRRLLQSYHCSAMTLNYLRVMVKGGFADFRRAESWNLAFLSKSDQEARYQKLVQYIQDAIKFIGSLGGVKEESLGSTDMYTSHEGLVLSYEEAMTRYVQESQRFYNLSAHMLWIGDRTRQLDHAHVEYFRGIANPIGIKIGPDADASEIIALIDTLNPQNEAGKIMLITRFGHEKVADLLPPMIRALGATHHKVLWCVDPMHGNLIRTPDNYKTRDFEHILKELRQTFKIHEGEGSILGGVHFELTGDDVTECIGGAENLAAHDLSRSYETYCDPRLNYSQSLEMAFVIASILRDGQDLYF